MQEPNRQHIARNLMTVHGLRAGAVAHEHIDEARRRGDTADLERWQDVEAAIAEMRRTEPKH